MRTRALWRQTDDALSLHVLIMVGDCLRGVPCRPAIPSFIQVCQVPDYVLHDMFGKNVQIASC